MTEAVDQANIEQVIAKYIELRDAVEREAALLKDKTKPMLAAMTTIETFLMKLSNDTGQTQFGTAAGTAFVTTKTGCNVTNWDETVAFIKGNDAFFLLNKAVNKTAVSEYMDAHQGALPPGVKWEVMKAIQIRRK